MLAHVKDIHIHRNQRKPPMTTASPSARTGGFSSWLGRTEAWLDDRGKGAWIALMVVAFVFVWPLGLALLAYLIWSKRMFKRSSCAARGMHGHHGHHRAYQTSGNTAFDAYKTETLRRLEEEQDAFDSFLQRLRDAKDKSEFDTFMEDRARNARPAAPSAETARGGEY